MYNRKALMLLNHVLYKTGQYTQSEALKMAWQLLKQPFTVKAAGVSFGNRQTALQHLTRYAHYLITLSLKRENNPFDANAIQVIAAVHGKGSYAIGYLPREWAVILAPLMDKGMMVPARFESVTGGVGIGNYGLRMKVMVA